MTKLGREHCEPWNSWRPVPRSPAKKCTPKRRGGKGGSKGCRVRRTSTNVVLPSSSYEQTHLEARRAGDWRGETPWARRGLADGTGRRRHSSALSIIAGRGERSCSSHRG